MMKKILGNIIILLLFSINLIASVSIKSDKTGFYPGESVNITITARGKDIKFPNLTDIAGYQIIGVANSSSTTIINGDVTNTKSKTYTITPEDTFTVPKLKVIVDEKEEWTNPLTIKKLKPTTSATKRAKYFVELKTDKKHLKVGESATVTVRFKIRSDIAVENVYLTPLKNGNFWIKKIGSENRYVDGMYDVIEQKYLLFAQKSGTFSVGPIKATMGFLVRQNMGGAFNNDPFFQQFFQTIKYKDIYSNQIQITVEALPNGLEVYGDFEIFATVDKKKVYANKPVNLTIKILGEGNIDDIKKFDINIPNAVVYADEPKVKSYIKNGKYYGEFSEKVAIIADRDFTIPAIKFTYFDKKSNKPITKETKPIDIKVIGATTQNTQNQPIIKEPIVQSKSPQINTKIIYKEKSKIDYLYLILSFLLGVIVTIIFVKISNKSKRRVKRDKPLEKMIFKAKTDKELYNLLLPYADKKEIQKILDKLEENIYKQTKHKIDKNEILDILEE